MADPQVLRVFVDQNGAHGNPLGVYLDAAGVDAEERQRIATELGFSETVFVEDRTSGRMRIHTPEVELPFAGHPCVGTAWLLAREGGPPEALRPPAGEVRVRFEDDRTWISARPEWCPAFRFVQLGSAVEVDALDSRSAEGDVYAWAWTDESAGIIRSRCFVPEAGIAEDEATGSAALGLAARLDRSITVRQGRGSILVARAAPGNWAEVGGSVAGGPIR